MVGCFQEVLTQHSKSHNSQGGVGGGGEKRQRFMYLGVGSRLVWAKYEWSNGRSNPEVVGRGFNSH